MKRPSCFSARGLIVAGPVSPGAPPAPSPPAPVPPPGREPFGLDPVKELLRSLRGHKVVLQVGEVSRKGKLISVDPLILAGSDGKAVLIRAEAVKAVEF